MLEIPNAPIEGQTPMPADIRGLTPVERYVERIRTNENTGR
jgi:hypothetical protein